MIPGPNGCTCGFNGDCNCPFVPSAASDATSLERDEEDDDEFDRDLFAVRQDEDFDDTYYCIGPDCVNPHVYHRRDECATAEQMEAYYADIDEEPR